MHHFGFLMDAELPTDDRPIVYVDPKDDDDATEIVAPNLRDFLGLVAISFAEVVSRSATDAQWFGFREEWYGDEPARLEEMRRLSDALCSIPGVDRPALPSKVANAHPDLAFRLFLEDEDEDQEAWPRTTLAIDFDNLTEARQACLFAQRALEERRFDEAIHHARCGLQHPAHRPRCLYVLATTYQRSRQKAAAKSTAEELLHLWLDPSPVAPPGVHPRVAIGPEELIALLEQVEGSQAGSMIDRVREAPELDEPSGDFL